MNKLMNEMLQEDTSSTELAGKIQSQCPGLKKKFVETF
jgi:hypothetical protein